jgi:IstB-like ATP binding protein
VTKTSGRSQAASHAPECRLCAITGEPNTSSIRAERRFPRGTRLIGGDAAWRVGRPERRTYARDRTAAAPDGCRRSAGQPLCLIGDSGTGKSHLLIGLGTAAAEQGYRVRYVTAAALVNELAEAADDRMLGKVITRYGRIDLLCLDELGYIELDRRGAELLFQVFTEREEKASIAIASNAAFSEWAQAFTDPRLCAAIVDRLTYDAHIITTGTGSYRLRATTARHQAARAAGGKEKGTQS